MQDAVLFGGFRVAAVFVPEHQDIAPQSKLGEHAPEWRAQRAELRPWEGV